MSAALLGRGLVLGRHRRRAAGGEPALRRRDAVRRRRHDGGVPDRAPVLHKPAAGRDRPGPRRRRRRRRPRSGSSSSFRRSTPSTASAASSPARGSASAPALIPLGALVVFAAKGATAKTPRDRPRAEPAGRDGRPRPGRGRHLARPRTRRADVLERVVLGPCPRPAVDRSRPRRRRPARSSCALVGKGRRARGAGRLGDVRVHGLRRRRRRVRRLRHAGRRRVDPGGRRHAAPRRRRAAAARSAPGRPPRPTAAVA